jgi:hypothetical protein
MTQVTQKVGHVLYINNRNKNIYNILTITLIAVIGTVKGIGDYGFG